MYVSPFLSRENSNTPKEYKNRARDEITRKLNIQPSPLSSNLRHGSSPLAKVTNASDTSLSRTNSHDSIDSQDSVISDDKQNKRYFGLSKLKQSSFRNKHTTSPSSSSLNIIHEHENQDVEMSDVSTAPEAHHSIPLRSSGDSIYSYDSQLSRQSTSNQSMATTNTYQPSLFSQQNSLATQFTNITISQPQAKQPLNQQSYLTLEEALPKSFQDIYSPELLSNPATLINGRPSFTKRPLQDWELNDIRSLLIVCELKPEWGYQLPIIYNPQGFKMEYLPLNSNDELIIKTLVNSEIYRESKFDLEFRIQTAKYTVFTARARHEQLMRELNLPNDGKLSKPEWRNIIENFMLNLAVESQCRLEYKKAMNDLKKFKKTESVSKDKGNLLKKALLNESALQGQSYKLSKDEKFQLWKGVQNNVYKRLGLDWKPDN